MDSIGKRPLPLWATWCSQHYPDSLCQHLWVQLVRVPIPLMAYVHWISPQCFLPVSLVQILSQWPSLPLLVLLLLGRPTHWLAQQLFMLGILHYQTLIYHHQPLSGSLVQMAVLPFLLAWLLQKLSWAAIPTPVLCSFLHWASLIQGYTHVDLELWVWWIATCLPWLVNS